MLPSVTYPTHGFSHHIRNAHPSFSTLETSVPVPSLGMNPFVVRHCGETLQRDCFSERVPGTRLRAILRLDERADQVQNWTIDNVTVM